MTNKVLGRSTSLTGDWITSFFQRNKLKTNTLLEVVIHGSGGIIIPESAQKCVDVMLRDTVVVDMGGLVVDMGGLG